MTIYQESLDRLIERHLLFEKEKQDRHYAPDTIVHFQSLGTMYRLSVKEFETLLKHEILLRQGEKSQNLENLTLKEIHNKRNMKRLIMNIPEVTWEEFMGLANKPKLFNSKSRTKYQESLLNPPMPRRSLFDGN